MKRIVYFLALAMTLVTAMTACDDHEDSVWASVPTQITGFLTQYFPEQGISHFAERDGCYYVTMKDGPSIVFDNAYRWTKINGNGETLPPVFLYDQLPPALYAYLEDLSETGGVYSATRNASYYEVVLENRYLRYDIESGEITSPY